MAGEKRQVRQQVVGKQRVANTNSVHHRWAHTQTYCSLTCSNDDAGGGTRGARVGCCVVGNERGRRLHTRRLWGRWRGPGYSR